MIIIQDYAGSKQLVYLASVPGWTPVGNAVLYRRSPVVRPMYGFDLEERIPLPGENTDISWSPIWAQSYMDKMQEGNIYQPLQTGFPISPFGQLMTSNHKYTVDFKFSPIIPTGTPNNYSYTGGRFCPYGYESATWETEYLVYLATINIAYPLLAASTVPDSGETFKAGPLFLKSIDFSMEELTQSLITVSLAGAKYFNNLSNPPQRIYDDYDTVYRRANFIDCFCDFNQGNPLWSSAEVRVVSIKLTVTQEFEHKFTCAKDGSSMDADKLGARFIELKSRTVSGSIQIFAKEAYIDPTLDNQMTMYFGGPFYFEMRNIRWQKPTMTIDLENGYLHTYEFIALADTAASLTLNPDINIPSCSEFYIGA